MTRGCQQHIKTKTCLKSSHKTRGPKEWYNGTQFWVEITLCQKGFSTGNITLRKWEKRGAPKPTRTNFFVSCVALLLET
jgi:hypothetical protein